MSNMMEADRIEAVDLSYREGSPVHRTADGCDLYYEVEGQGPSITFVSTIYVVSTAWRAFTGNLVQNHQVLTYDLRNQGTSGDTALGFGQHSDDLLSLLDHLGIEKTYLVGTSISTLICRDFAVAHPDRVAGLVLIGTPLSPWGSNRRRRIAKSWLTAVETGGPRALFDQIYPLVFGDKMLALGGNATYLALRERFLAMNTAEQLAENLRESIDASDDVELLRSITAPALLLNGDDDFCNSPASLHALAEILPRASVEIIEGCGHLPFFEATDRFQASVADFVATTESRAK
ncbi:alpha/beta fold hydrolase [Nocardia asteroides]|uniref:Hydrolase n=1 Tax=Nocardia asteroides NBRC 15531 TaxID=1110697 RepID=U5ELN8_NOCAS|nr:alpha/beta hydrolase [Nocardia asteroides]UGT46988.1 alpha/beta hydrolase [Nocardia asteroides]GAD87306.1 putative hydrolase [Nocardia asteroides NBRC 15531]SFM82903.1 Pimeloyl-ACP methyl ester carboxylesterase [Nocardia asteroides]VEG34146.1 Haloacetate dehalogenase H-1 [Nocardia asteroides]